MKGAADSLFFTLALMLAIAALPPGARGTQGGGMSELEVGQSGGSGYLKSYAIGIFPKRIADAPAELTPGTGGQFLNALRLNAFSRPAGNVKLEAAYEFQALGLSGTAAKPGGPTGALGASPPLTGGASYRLVDLNRSITDTADGRNYLLSQNLDRLAAYWNVGRADITIGRQAIAFGQAKVIQATDVLLPYSFQQINTEYRLGVDAVRAQIPLSQMGEIDCGVVAGEKARSDASAAFARVKVSLAEADLVGMAMVFSGAQLLGGGIQRGLWQLGYYLDFAQVWTADNDRYFRLSQGLDYAFASGLTLFAEYHFNGAGTDEPAGYLARRELFAYTKGGVFLLGRHYLIPGFTYPFTPLLNSRLQTIVNLPDGSTFLSGGLEYGLAENVYLDAGFFVPLGRSPRPAAGGFTPASEFGSYPIQVYGAVKWYF